MLRDLTREILRDQPEDISSYGYSYFLVRARETAPPPPLLPGRVSRAAEAHNLVRLVPPRRAVAGTGREATTTAARRLVPDENRAAAVRRRRR